MSLGFNVLEKLLVFCYTHRSRCHKIIVSILFQNKGIYHIFSPA
jgi:hypothetical protein